MTFTKDLLELHRVGGFPDLLKAYNSGNAGLRPLYNREPSASGISELVSTYAFPEAQRMVLSEAIAAQYRVAGVKPGPETSTNIGLLKDNNTFTVCTGHQLCLFTGPLYFIYKIISAINLAEKLKKENPAFNFVPVYWMATEDHDFEEISQVQIFGKKYTWSAEQALGVNGAIVPCGQIKTASLAPLLAEIETVLGKNEQAARISTWLKEAYLGHDNLADATRCFTNLLLGAYGLVILDGNDKTLKALFSPVMEEELSSMPNRRLVQEGMEALSKLGYEAQVNPREINLFYMKTGLRARIEKSAAEDKFQVLGTDISFNRAGILSELKQHPERFSPNVVLRPLYQQMIMPNIVYVGGPGELAYWMEFKKMFDYHRVLFPVLMPRNFAVWIDAASSNRMEKLQLDLPALSAPLPELEKSYLNKQSNAAERLEEETEQLKNIYSSIGNKAVLADATLKAAAEAELQKVLGGLKNLEAKMTRAAKLRHETALSQIKALKEKMFPGAGLQERVDNFMPLYLKYGADFIPGLKRDFDPFEKKLYVFTEKHE